MRMIYITLGRLYLLKMAYSIPPYIFYAVVKF